MTVASAPRPSDGGNSTSKILRDFILGGTSGAIAKTLEAVHGSDAVRYAMSMVSITGLLAAWLYYRLAEELR